MKDFLTVLGVIGIPSIFSICLWSLKKCLKFGEQVDILQSAQKAQMRSQLLKQFYDYKEHQPVASDDVDDWINQYNAYHKLVGENGVLDARKEEILRMPTYTRH